MLQLLSLILLRDDQSIQVSRRSNLEFHVVLVSLDLHRLGILLPGLLQEVLDLLDLFGHLCVWRRISKELVMNYNEE